MTKNIIVHFTDTRWTTVAMREACQLARERQEKIALLKLLPADYLAWHGGDEADEYQLSESESNDLASYQTQASAAGCDVELHVIKYDNIDKAIEQAADDLNADIVFANLPHHLISFFDRLEVRTLSQHLEENQHQLRSFDAPVADSDG